MPAAGQTGAETPPDLRAMRFAEILVCENVLRSALLRRESRGAHVRRDFPEERTAWQANLQCRLTAEHTLEIIKQIKGKKEMSDAL